MGARGRERQQGMQLHAGVAGAGSRLCSGVQQMQTCMCCAVCGSSSPAAPTALCV